MKRFETDSHLMARETLHAPLSEEIFNLREELSGFDSGEGAKRISIASLGTGDALKIRTYNSIYRLVMLDPPERRILIRGGQYFQRPAEACLLGSAFRRKIQVGHLVVGRGLGFSVGRRCFITSPIELIEREAAGEGKTTKSGAA